MTAGSLRRARGRKTATPSFIAVSTVMLWLCTAIAATAFWPVYQSDQFLLMVAVTTVVASAIAIVGALYRLQGHVVVIATVLAYFVLGVPLAVPDQALYGVLPTIGGLRDLTVGTALSWKQLLTITLPVGSYQSLLVPAFIIVLVTVTAALSVALRARFAELSVIGPVVVLISAILFGETTEFLPLEVSLGLTAATLFWLIWFRWYRRRAAIRSAARRAPKSDGPSVDDSSLNGLRTLLSAALIIAIAAGGAAGAAALLPPTGERDVLRSAIVQPFDPRAYASPLSGFRRYHQAASENSTMLTLDGLPEGARVRIATLDSYDGIVYSVGSDQVSSESGSFTLVPYEFDQSAIAGEQVTLDVTVGAYSGVWLPTVGKFESIRFSGQGASSLRGSFYYNDNTGTAAVVQGVGPGDEYRLTAVLPTEPSDSQLAEVTPGSALLPAIGVLPDELAVALDRYVGSVQGDGRRLLAAIDGLRRDGYISHGVSDDEPTSRSGHSADRITQLFTDQRMIGDEEQYSVAAALMARELGFPARVVIGFLPQDVQPDGSTVVSGADISAWIEVDTVQFGWVTIDPTPPVREIPEELPEEPTQVARPQAPVQPPVEDQQDPEDQLPPDAAQDEVDTVDPFLVVLFAVLQIGGWVLLAAAILMSPFIAIVAAKLRRRALRRRAPTPLDRISGGWREFEDAVLDHGFSPPPSPTRSEFAEVVGGMQPLVLAAAADRAVFSPSGPDAEDADHVWRSVEELRASLDKGLTRWQRIKARVSLRSLDSRGARRFLSRSRAK